MMKFGIRVFFEREIKRWEKRFLIIRNNCFNFSWVIDISICKEIIFIEYSTSKRDFICVCVVLREREIEIYNIKWNKLDFNFFI